MPSDATFKVANLMQRTLIRVTGGRLGWNGAGMPVVELTTIGRKSGHRRTVFLTSPVQEGDTIVVVASAGGNDVNPDWIFNIRANPNVDVTMRGKAQKMTAQIADATERARLWPQITAKFKTYGGYQEKTDREIPLVLLQPAQ